MEITKYYYRYGASVSYHSMQLHICYEYAAMNLELYPIDIIYRPKMVTRATHAP